MDLHVFGAAAAALAVERITYIWMSRWPHAFERLLRRSHILRSVSPVHAVAALFAAFKLLQGAVFLQWLVAHGASVYELRSPTAAVLGVVLFVFGQQLNI